MSIQTHKPEVALNVYRSLSFRLQQPCSNLNSHFVILVVHVDISSPSLGESTVFLISPHTQDAQIPCGIDVFEYGSVSESE